MAARRVALALVHHPVLDREGGVITTAITNLDVHDIARSARTYSLEAFYVVHPVDAQRGLVEKVREHWVEGGGAKRIPDRKEALALVRVVASLDEVFGAFGGGEAPPEIWTTAAKGRGRVWGYGELRARLASPGPPVLLLFGTGWGLTPEIQDRADVRVAPVVGVGTWNHLSVRAACAITLDRLLGVWA